MRKDTEFLYEAFKSKDKRFDGRFFVGVFSTKIYCRPICRAKIPKIENCTFYQTASEAEQAGFRPCLLCRPEMAPGNAIIDRTSSLAQSASQILEENCFNGQSIEEIADLLGCTSRHLHRVFTKEYHVSPIQYLQTCRLLLSKSLLTETSLSVLDIAMASGFNSLRRFNDVFKKQYQLTPTELRRKTIKKEVPIDKIVLALGYRPPYQWNQMLEFLAMRAIAGVEKIENNEYWRTIHFVTKDKRSLFGLVKVENCSEQNILKITINSSLLPALPYILARIKHLFDLSCDPHMIYEKIKSINNIIPNSCVLGTRLPGSFDPFEMAIRAILGQQITVKAAQTIAGRLAQKFGTPLQTGVPGLTHVFPTPENIVSLEGKITDNLGPLGIISKRAETILLLAQAFVNKSIDFYHCLDPEEEIKKLITLPGIGIWTAQYIAMRAMGYPDAFLHTDLGIIKALSPKKPNEILLMAEEWRPWRAYAIINLWNTL